MLISYVLSYINHIVVVKRYSPHTARNYSMDLEAFINFLFYSKDPKSDNKSPSIYSMVKEGMVCCSAEVDIEISYVTRTSIRKFLAHMYQLGKCRRTILRRYASIRSFCNFAISESIILHNPCENIDHPKKPPANDSFVDKEAIFTFFDSPNLRSVLGFRDRCIMELLYCTGMRVSELVGVNVNNIDFENNTIKIHGKGKIDRMVFINEAVSEWLKAYINHAKRKAILEKSIDNAVFLNCFGNRISTRSVDRAFKQYLSKSDMFCSITPHTLRRALACNYLERGVDIKKIKKILGHKSLASTTLYAKSTSKLRIDEYNRAHPRS
ncbi:MAG: tyrosine-type recombinase/integrase [Chlamydiia bacterium]|nr:tyrosine-type recombinase/integrase [Chlamydiia bacterium]